MKPLSAFAGRHIKLLLLFVITGLAAGLFWSVGINLPSTGRTISVAPDGSALPPGITRLLGLLNPATAWANPAYAPREAVPSILVENFENVPAGGFPKGWKAWRADDGHARKLYTVREEKGNRYLSAKDDGTSIIIRKEMTHWNPQEYPLLSWRWRAGSLPVGADEREAPRNDSAAALYVVLDQNFFGVPKTLKYVWSTTVPVGTRYRREGVGRPTVIVLESGTAKQGQWVTETVNVYDDFVAVFGKAPPRNAIGIGILTDNNATGSPSQGDYDDLIAQRRGASPKVQTK